MFSSKLCHTKDGSHGKYPVKTCCVSDDLSGDMLAPSWSNLVLSVNRIFQSVIRKKTVVLLLIWLTVWIFYIDVVDITKHKNACNRDNKEAP